MIPIAAATTREGAAIYLLLHAAAFSAWLVLGARRFPRLVTALLALATVVNGAGWAFGLLDRVWNYDAFAHLVCTFALTLPAGITLARRRSGPFDASLGFAAVGVGLAGGLVWEWYEWYFDQFGRAAHTMSVEDTLSDLTAGVLGASCTALTLQLLSRRSTWPFRH